MISVERVKRNQIRMMKERGYIIPPIEEAFLKGEPPGTLPDLQTLYSKPNADPFIVVLYIPLDRKNPRIPATINKDTLESVLNPVVNQFGNTLKHIILIGDPPNAKADIQLMDMIQRKALTIERFSYENLSIVPVDHVSVPKHRLLTFTEAQKLSADLKTSLTRMPRIKTSDPIAKWYGAKRGDIFEITSRSVMTDGIIPTYRITIS